MVHHPSTEVPFSLDLGDRTAGHDIAEKNQARLGRAVIVMLISADPNNADWVPAPSRSRRIRLRYRLDAESCNRGVAAGDVPQLKPRRARPEAADADRPV